MKKKSSAFFCFLLILATLLTSCLAGTDTPSASTETGTSETTEIMSSAEITETDALTSEAATSVQTTEAQTSAAQETTGATEPTVPESPDPFPGISSLLYYENFESYGTISSTSSTVSALGWSIQNTSDGAYKDSTADYSIVSHNGSNQLYVSNNKSGAADSYIMLLSKSQFGFFHKFNYTIQYDIEYADAGDNSRYITLVSEYSGSFYDSFHFRNGGYADNQCHAYGSWYTYDDSTSTNYAANKSSTSKYSIAYKLLGKYYDGTQLFKGISVSVRYVMDWENGIRVYMRVNTPGYNSTGKWILVSEYSAASSAAEFLTPNAGNGAVVLKTGTTQNGYIDNIIIWRGTGSEPADKTSALLSSRTSGHSYLSISGVETCIYTGKTRENVENTKWLLDGVPVYSGGILYGVAYKCGQGYTLSSFNPDNDSLMQLISSTTQTQFASYLSKLSSSGYTQDYYYTCENNIYASYYNGYNRVYTYYTAASKTARVILDRSSDCSVTDFSYSYTKKKGDTTIIYQYGLPMNEAGVNIANNSEQKIDCGMMYVIKLADNSVVIIDGGGYQQFDTAEIDGFMSFLQNVTGAGENGKIRIAGWYITHCHSDHFAGLCLFIKKYSSRLNVERIFFNFPSVYTNDATLSGHKSNYQKLLSYIKTYLNSDITFLKLHTGEVIQLADVSFQVLFTHEDIVDNVTASTGISGDFNNSCTVLRITFDGKTFMLLGDINRPAMTIIMNNYTSNTLKADVVQLAHHVINNVSELYKVIQAPVVFVPQSPNGSTLNTTRQTAFNTAMQYVKNNMLYYASKGTYGISADSGTLSLVFTDKVYGGAYTTAWGW
jgi:hypothetical protein